MTDLGPMTASMKRADIVQDAISWCKFMNGKVTKTIASMQRTQCEVAPCMMNRDNWMCHFISFILHITIHSGSSGTSLPATAFQAQSNSANT